MVEKGFSPQQAGLISAFENGAAAVGCIVLTAIADRGFLGRVLLVTYAAIAASLWGLGVIDGLTATIVAGIVVGFFAIGGQIVPRSEEHTSELQSLMRLSYAVFCLKKKNKSKTYTTAR